MKNKNNIDELFKSKLEERAFDIKPAFLDQLNGQLDARAKGKRKRFIYFLAGFALLLSVLFVGILMQSNDQSTGSKQTHSISKNEAIKTNDNFRNTVLNEMFGTSESGVSNETDQNQSENFAESNGKVNQSSGKEGLAESNGKINQGTGKEGLVESNGKTKQGTEKEGLAESNGKTKQGTGKEGLAESNGKIKQGTGKEGLAESNGKTKQGSGKEGLTESNGKINQGTGKEGLAESGGELSETGKEQPEIKSNEASGEENSALSKEESKDVNKNPDVPGDKAPATEKAESPWSLQFSIGGNYVTKYAIEGSQESIPIRKSEELNIFTPQINFGVNYDLNKLRLSTGLSFTQHGENLNYSEVQYDTAYISSYDAVIDTASNDTTYVPVYTTDTDTSNAAMQGNQNNRHSYITLPINFGYTFNIVKDKFTITPKGGVGIRFLVGGSGNYITNDLLGILEEKDKSITFSYNGSIEFAYHFGNKSLFFAPTYHSTFSTFKSLHRYGAIGVKLGVVWKL